jgi:hypothetical protein
MCEIKGVRTGASKQLEEIEPQGFVAGEEMSASAVTAMRVSYVHACIQVLHFAQRIEIHRIIGSGEHLVHFILKALIAGWVEQ